jgi:hypothetical protein
VVADTGLRFS